MESKTLIDTTMPTWHRRLDPDTDQCQDKGGMLGA